MRATRGPAATGCPARTRSYFADLDLLREVLPRPVVLGEGLLLGAADFLGADLRGAGRDAADFAADVLCPFWRFVDGAPTLVLWLRTEERERVSDFIWFVAILSLQSPQTWASSPVRG